MLSDEQLADQLRAELEPLRPPGDLADRVRQQAQTNSRRFGRVRSSTGGPRFRIRLAGTLALAASIIAVVVVLGAILEPGPNTATTNKAAANTTPATRTAKHRTSPAKKARHVKNTAHKAVTTNSAPALPTTSASAIPPTTSAAPPAITTTTTTATPTTTSATPPATTTTTTATPPLTKKTHHKGFGCPPYCGY